MLYRLSYPGVSEIIPNLLLYWFVQKSTSFLLILAAAFLIILFYVLSHVYDYGPKEVLGLKSTTKIILVGDIMLGRSVMTESLKKNNLSYPFESVAIRLESADMVFANLESPFAENCPQVNSGMKFCADPGLVEGISEAGINVVTLANNHINNYGTDGLATTKRVLTENHIDATGDGNLVVKEVNGTKFGFVGLNLMYRGPDKFDEKLISESDKLVDVLVVGVHWGEEYKNTANKNQRASAKRLVDLGADVISGHHPHWVQDSELIDGKPVYYSLGNFVFDQMWSEETKKGMIVELEFDGPTLISQNTQSTYIRRIGQPEFVSTE